MPLPPGVVGSCGHRLLFVERETCPRDPWPEEAEPIIPHPSATETRIVSCDAFDL